MQLSRASDFAKRSGLIWDRSEFQVVRTRCQQFRAPNGRIDGATAVTLGPQSILYIAGQTPGELVPGAAGGVLDAYLQARRLDGSVVFTKQVGGIFDEQVYAVLAKPDGTVYVGGRTSGGFLQFMGYGSARVDLFLMRFDP